MRSAEMVSRAMMRPPTGGLDGDLEQVLGDQALELFAHHAAAGLGLVAVDDDRSARRPVPR